MTRIRIEKIITTAGDMCGSCEFLEYSTINTFGRAWCCNAFDYRLTANLPAGCGDERRARKLDRVRVPRCDQCLAFDTPSAPTMTSPPVDEEELRKWRELTHEERAAQCADMAAHMKGNGR